MTTPGDQVKSLRSAIERQQAARDAARETARTIAQERQDAQSSDEPSTEE